MKQHLLAVKTPPKAHVFKVFCSRKLRCNMLNQLTCHTPKRKAVSSNLARDASTPPEAVIFTARAVIFIWLIIFIGRIVRFVLYDCYIFVNVQSFSLNFEINY